MCWHCFRDDPIDAHLYFLIPVNILLQGRYYGHPNPLRAAVMNQPRQCKWRAPTEASDADYTAPLVIAPSSTGAICEFESDHFG